MTSKVNHDRRSGPAVPKPKLKPAKWRFSCDQCKHQEGRHYCLLHTMSAKNMDTVRCDDWEEKG